ncbi:hypothetical protein GEMRC1_004393 [Eukaryota sp. GEM-RC1]
MPSGHLLDILNFICSSPKQHDLVELLKHTTHYLQFLYLTKQDLYDLADIASHQSYAQDSCIFCQPEPQLNCHVCSLFSLPKDVLSAFDIDLLFEQCFANLDTTLVHVQLNDVFFRALINSFLKLENPTMIVQKYIYTQTCIAITKHILQQFFFKVELIHPVYHLLNHEVSIGLLRCSHSSIPMLFKTPTTFFKLGKGKTCTFSIDTGSSSDYEDNETLKEDVPPILTSKTTFGQNILPVFSSFGKVMEAICDVGRGNEKTS